MYTGVIVKIENVQLGKLIPFQPKNVKSQTPRERKKLRLSLEKHGQQVPLFCWKKGAKIFIVDGHHRYSVLKEMDIKTAKCWLIPLKTEAEVKKFYAINNAKFSRINKSNYLEFLSDLKIDFDIDLNIDISFKEVFNPDASPLEATDLSKFDFFPYFGGKSSLCRKIVQAIPKHGTYIEPFVGGGAVFWVKAPSKFEVINDRSKLVTNFYMVCKSSKHFKDFAKKLELRLYSENFFKKIKSLDIPDCKTPNVDSALDFYFSIITSFSTKGDSMRISDNAARALLNKIDNVAKFKEEIVNRLCHVSVFNRDAVSLINHLGKESDAFFYVDPPYPGAEHGYYPDFPLDKYHELLDVLGGVSGKFILSTYADKKLASLIKQKGWKKLNKVANPFVGGSGKQVAPKVETTVCNF